MVEFNYEGVKIKILQGYGEIGGNCIVVENGDSRVIFDQGIRFSKFKKFYNHNISPAGPSEMIKLGIIPSLTDPIELFITHFHLDHLGLLHPLYSGTTVYVPNEQIFNSFITPYTTANNWTTYISPPIGVEVSDAIKNNVNVLPISVEHSAYPAFSYYYDSGRARILYTGDMRISSPLINLNPEVHRRLHEKTLLEEYEEKGLTTDVLIIEGTNFSSHNLPVTSNYFIEQLFNIFKSHSNSLLLVSIDSLDAEAILSMLEIARLYGRTPVIEGRRLTNMAKVWVDLAGVNLDIHQLGTEELNFNVIMEDEIKKNPSQYVILSSKGDILEFARKANLGKGSVVISLSAEAPSESEENENVEDNWLKMLGFIIYRLRMSGHYYPFELKEILDTIKPKKVIPIHTEVPSLMCEYIEQLGYECLSKSS
ncbi:MBL fold metallo-hydrolase [Sulfolobus sp. S-194]|uniref:MBL fold metallo-hydrolase n=1 Tax=Sulfolobus sp. S-194 TaxID=2512240 RepID=UPI001437356F|nr:MBL fold metallo-hydrolase [Sulfolobus sp. S-194]QIW23759.1 MBL fold metallo-hydrolase [Sulfolobus sp. S-194]